MATITIVLDSQKDSKGLFINKQVIKCSTRVMFENDKMTRLKSPDELNRIANSIAHDINPKYVNAYFNRD